MTYEEGLAMQARLYTHMQKMSLKLTALKTPKGPMGLTPNHIKASTAWRDAKHDFDNAFQSVQLFNLVFTRDFKKEIRADRNDRIIRAIKEAAQ